MLSPWIFINMPPSFIHLRVHSEYSIVDGIVRIKPLVQKVAQAGMPAVAITEQNNLFSAVKFYKSAIASGIKPIIGVDLWLNNPQQSKQPFRLTLLCQDDTGYRNVTRLISRAYLEGQVQGFSCIDKSWLQGAAEGLIALSGGRIGDIGQALLAQNKGLAESLLQDWRVLFPNRFYLELQRTGKVDEENYNQAALLLAVDHSIPVVATNDVCFLSADDFEAHEARVCIHDGTVLGDNSRSRRFSSQQYLRTQEEMCRLFSDVPEALENTVEIAKRCNLSLSLGKSFLPKFPIPSSFTAESYLSQQAKQGLEFRLQLLKIQDRLPYELRLQEEIDIINRMGYAGYFLIVADFILWAKQHGIPVGPGRGSGAGSLVAYALQIIDIDPIAYNLLFERFLNPERVSMPDFDIDFCMDGRDRVIDYVAHKYGRDSVSQIITYGSMAAKAVVRDVGRVLGFPYGFVDKVAKLIPFELGITLDKALEQEEELKRRYDQEEDVHTLIDLAKKLEGLTRNAGKHAGGVVISPTALTDFTPLYCEPGGANLVSQFDKDDVEAVGLVKFDFLGLRTLTIISWAVDAINEHRKKTGDPLINISLLSVDDEKTFDLIKSGSTTAIFQLESRGMKDLVKRLQPDCLEDIISLVALFRPGPLQSGMVDDFIQRRHGRVKVEYPHLLLEPVLRPTYGIILYQEQVMQIAQILAGYTLGGADLLRRAMGKKKPEEMAKQRSIFVGGAKERGIDEELASSIFDLMEKFAGYGFNKSHSAAYALLTYQTAWLKANFPAQFMAAVLSSDMDNTDKVVGFIYEARQMQLNIIPPDINRSHYKFTVTNEGHILYGLGAIKGAGEAAISIILQNRQEEGLFTDLFSFCQRIDLRKVNRRVLEALIKAGALDSFNQSRAVLLANIEHALQAAEQHANAHLLGQKDLFGSAITNTQSYISVSEASKQEILQGEKETLGYYLSGHPIQVYEAEFAKFITIPLGALSTAKTQSVTIAGLIINVRTMFTKRGDRMAFITLEDRTGMIELTVFSELYEENKEILIKDQIIIAEGEVSVDDYTGNHKIVTRVLYSLKQAREKFAKSLMITLQHNNLQSEVFEKLAEILTPFLPGRCPIQIHYENHAASAQLVLGQQWRVMPHDELLMSLRRWLGEQHVNFCY